MNKEENTQENPEQVNPTGELNGQQALNVLIQAVRVAQGKGAYTLEDAEMISRAIKVFVPPTPAEEQGTEADPVVNEGAENGEEVPATPRVERVGNE